MRLWDERGRIGGWIHPVDLAIIILVAVIGLRMIIPVFSGLVRSQPRDVTVGLMIKNIPPYLAESIKLGQDVYRDGSEAFIGRVAVKRALPAELLLERDGKVILAQAPRNLDLYLKLRGQARVAAGPGRIGVLLGKTPIRVGDPLRAHTLYTAFTAEVESVKLNP